MAKVKYRNGLAKVGRVYHYQFTQDGTPYHGSTRCEIRCQAEAWLQKKRQDIALETAGILIKPAAALPTLAQTLADWARAMKGSATDLHIKNVGDALNLHMQQLLPLTLDQITTERVEDARTAYLNTVGVGSRPGQKGTWDLPHTKAGANKIVQHLGSVLGWAVRREIIPALPYKLKPLKPKEDIKAVLWPEQVVQFLHAAENGRRARHHAFPHSYTAMLLMLELGLRENEALDARWERLDLRRKVYMCPGKNQGVREIAVPEFLLDHLARVLGPTTKIPRGLILPGEDGQAHSGQFTLHPVARCGLALGIVGLTPHRLRASFATCHFEANTSLSQIQQMMGHEDQETTMGYIIQRPKDQAQAQEEVASRMGLKVPEFPKVNSMTTTPEATPEKAISHKPKLSA